MYVCMYVCMYVYVASVHDPLGLAAPMVLPAKRIVQELCRLGHSWDEGLPEQVASLEELLSSVEFYQGEFY